MQHALNSSGRSVAARVRGALQRALVLGAWFFSGVALAQNAGPVVLTGSGGVESTYDSNAAVGTGGVVTTFGAYTIHEFEANANFNPPAGVVQVDVLVVGGGGGGGGDQQGGGGGGAGGLVWTENFPVIPGTNYAAVIGGAGAGGTGTGNGTTGTASSFNATIIGNGGGGGGRGDTSAVGVAGGSGGGGGGGDDATTTRAGGVATQGNSGGVGTASIPTANNRRGGGGGGAALVGGTGGTGTDGGVGGSGGAARDFSTLLGTNVGVGGFFAGGGGGGKQVGAGGTGGGGGGGEGSGSTGVVVPTAGIDNTGGGGGGRGGATDAQVGAAGGSGVVVIRYLTPLNADYVVHRFDVNNAGPFTPPEGVSAADVLVVAGGGSGGGDRIGGGGGGAGGWIWTPNVGMAVTPYAITIGAGGNASTTVGNSGASSAFAAISTTGGGGGGHGEAANAGAAAGLAGGSGGGGGGTGGANGAGGAGTTGQGNAGALGTHSGNNNNDRGGGGGGAGSAGTIGDQNISGAGGTGRDFSALLGTSVGASGWFAGGGGGGNRTSGTGGPGGTGGGGAGGTGIGTAGTLGTGGGGGGTGGGADATSSAIGGSGAVVVRYRPSTMEIFSQVTASNVLSGDVFPQNIVIRILDAGGNPMSGVNVTGALSSAVDILGGTLGGTLVRATNASGLATFDNLTITGAVGNRRINFTATGSTDTVETNNISVASITFSQQTPVIVLSGQTFPATVPTILVQNGGGPVAGVNVTVAIQSGAGTLSGTTVVATNGSGLAAFSNIAITGVAGNRTLSFTPAFSTGNVVSNSISVAIMTVTQPPAGSVMSGQIINLPPIIEIFDGSGAMVGVNVTASLGAGAGTLGGTLIVATNGSGQASFDNLQITGVTGFRTLRFTPAFTVGFVDATPISVAAMAITQQPSPTVLTGLVMSQAPTIQILDAGNSARVGINVTAAIETGTGVLGGTATVATDAGGFAVFNNISITGSGNHTLSFTAAGSPVEVVSATVSVTSYHFTITHALTDQVCASSTEITIRVFDQNDAPVLNFDGTVTIDNNLGSGDYTLNTGTPVGFDNLTADDGIAEYEFDPVDDGVVILDFTTTNTGSYEFDVTSGTYLTEDYAIALEVLECEFRISHDLNAAACAPDQITIGVYDTDDNVVTGYVGNVTLSSSGVVNGNWTVTTTPANANGTLGNAPANDGIATYNFVLADAGTIILNYRANAGTANFDVVATNVTSPTGADDPDLVITACAFRISHGTTADVCSVAAITLSVVDGGGIAVANFAGNVNLSTSGVAGGNWTNTTAPADANGALDNGASGDGAATYTFVAADAGNIILNFQAGAAGTANFNAVSAGVTAPASPHDANLVISACTFRITHSSPMDVCSIEAVTITLVNSGGATVTNYTGTINLSTTTGFGSWRESGSQDGLLTDPVAEDGNATYLFDAADLGTVTLNFLHTTASGVVNINVSDGVTLDPRNFASAYDQNITVNICTFEISHSEAMTACEIEAVTFTVRNSIGGVAVDYTGTMTLGTQTNHGNWLDNDSDGVLTDTVGDDNGVATYEFVDSDNGVIVLNFANPHAEGVNFNAVDGDILVDANADPNLIVSSCLPGLVGSAVCTVGTTTNLTIPAQNSVASLRGRMVLMIIAGSGATPVATATFNSQPMTRISQEISTVGEDSIVEMWGILDINLPGSGSYAGAYTGAPAGSAMCLLAIDQVQQGFPVETVPPEAGPLNSSQGTVSSRTTTITTTENNSLMVVGSNFDAATFWNFAAPAPTSLVRIFGQGATPIANPVGTGSRFGGSAGRQPTAGLVNVVETLTSAPATVNTQIVAAFEPLVAGTPIAGNYEPVLLFQTFSGNMSYRAVGNTLRSTYNETAPAPLGCNFVPFATGSATTLTLPVGAVVEAAYLYWSGSGSSALGQVDDDVTFGLTGSEQAITADDVFLIDNVGVDSNVDYFTGYRDVSDLVTGDGSYTLKDLTVQIGSPWNTAQSCAGGWAMIVVYEHNDERLRVLNLFHGFQPFQNSNFTLVPRNFRMATSNAAENLPNGQVTHITIEGDETLNAVDAAEGLSLQDGPGSVVYTNVTSSLNPLGQEFNSTVTRPTYSLDGTTGYFEINETGGLNGDGYEIDFPGPQAGTGGPRFGNTWGLDVDTHYFQGANLGEPLFPFAQPGLEAEQITTRYSAAADLVLLISEVISVTNFPLADIEIFTTPVGTFKVNTAAIFEIEVTNNGDGAAGGFADGEIMVAGTLPPGMTFANVGDVAGADWSCSVTLDPGAYTCIYDIAADWTGGAVAGELGDGESLPTLTLNVLVGNNTFFPLRNNNAKFSARVLHSGGNCDAANDGVIPDPDDCDRSPQFDNYNDLEGGNLDINNIDDKQVNNNNIDSDTVIVKGVEVDLVMDKFVDGILEIGEPGVYTLRVTNSGPDATTATITVTDTDPTGVDFVSAAGTGWVCPTPPGNLSCTYAGSLGVGASTDILLTVDITGADGYNVTNTATVTAGAFNFDVTPGNNTNTDITEIVGPPVASQEKFLLSVSSLGGLTSIGGLSNFEDDDYIIYDPVTDTAEMFFDNSVGFEGDGFDVRDADAVHLMKNGHIVISAENAGSTVGTNNLAFEPGDLVVYDPIVGTAIMLFDGSTIFGGANPGDVNITAVYLLDNGDIIFAATPAPGSNTVGSNNQTFTSADLILYDVSAGTASLFFNGSTYFDDTTDVTINGFYMRVDPANPNGNIDQLILSVSDANDDSITIGATLGWDPETGTIFTQDDVTQINLDDEETENLFLGDVELGIFDPADVTRRIDALHVIEDGYIGHFRISQVGGEATVCSMTGLEIRISKHEGLTHVRDTDYYGSVVISTDTEIGDWLLISGNGTLDNGTADDGVATYKYLASDGGTVILALSQSVAGTVNVDVTNGIAREGHPPGVGAEAPTFIYDQGVTLNYLDNFNVASYGNQNGTHGWATDWLETDVTAGAASGDVRVTGGAAVFTRTGGTTEPGLVRAIDLSGATLESDLILSFNYSYANLGTFSEFVVEARHSNAASWEEVAVYKRGTTLPNIPTGNAASGNLNISAELLDNPTASTQIRFYIRQGYTLTGQTFSVDDVKLSAVTTNCNVSPLGVNHYEININGVTNGTYGAVACVGMEVTITAHASAHSAVEPGNLPIFLTTSTNRGNWSRVITGDGVLSNGSLNDGAATYTFPADETSVKFHFDYTGLLTDPEAVNINVTDNAQSEIVGEDPNGSVSQVGLRILNSGTNDAGSPIPLQIAGKPSNLNPVASVLYVQVVNSTGTNPSVCEPLFAVGQTLELEFAAECDDPMACVTATETFEVNGTEVPLIDNGDPVNHTAVEITLVDADAGAPVVPGAPIVIQYSDVGRMRLHTRFDIPLGDNLDPLLATKSGDTLDVASNQFIVRPFGFDIDFDDDRATNTNASRALDHTGTRWRIAGESFNTTVTSVGWEVADDADYDGIPDTDANLSNNHVTPNFDQDLDAGNYRVMLTVDQDKVEALGGIRGILTDEFFDGFVSGAATHTINYNEVGIIDLSAKIVNQTDIIERAYLDIDMLEHPNAWVRGYVKNVGRFYPNLFTVETRLLNSRANASCSPESTFTYMNEEFELVLQLTATGLSEGGDYVTKNYRGVYAKLDAFEELGLVAIQDVSGASDIDFSARLVNAGIPPNFAANWNLGVLSLTGNVIFQRNSPSTPDGPFPNMKIGFLPMESGDAGVTIDPQRFALTATGVLDVDLDVFPTEPGTSTHYLIEEHEFRYGRLIVNNAYGPETENLALTFLVEYFNGSEFVRNSLDNCTSINAINLSYDVGTYTPNLDDGDTELLPDPDPLAAPNTPDAVTFLEGQTQGVAGGGLPTDAPLETSAPGEGNGGTVDVVLDLVVAGLEYLGFEWDDADDDYNENPRGQIEFGQFRNHDRVINWQEIYNRPTP